MKQDIYKSGKMSWEKSYAYLLLFGYCTNAYEFDQIIIQQKDQYIEIRVGEKNTHKKRMNCGNCTLLW